MTIRSAESMPVLPSEWVARGYHGHGNVETLIGSLAGRSAIVCGNGAGVFQELETARALVEDAVIFGVNDVGMYLPDMDHWVSLHHDKLFTWSLVRHSTVKTNHPLKVHSVDARQGVDYVWDRLVPCFSISGYFAMQIAWIMGAERIVLCGCPGTSSPRFFEATPRQIDGDGFGYGDPACPGDRGISRQVEKEMQRVGGFKAAVRSMSGWTKEFFGGLE